MLMLASDPFDVARMPSHLDSLLLTASQQLFTVCMTLERQADADQGGLGCVSVVMRNALAEAPSFCSLVAGELS